MLYCLGAKFTIWCGCYASQVDDRACLACYAVYGYHSKATYEWLRNGTSMSEGTPLLYTSCEGDYRCKVKSGDEELTGLFKLLRMCKIKVCLYTVIVIITLAGTWDGILVECLNEKLVSVDKYCPTTAM